MADGSRALQWAVLMVVLHVAGSASAALGQVAGLKDYIWARTPEAATSSADPAVLHDGSPTLKIVHTGENDWAIEGIDALEVKPGDIVEIDAAVRVQGPGSATVSMTTRDPAGQVVEWLYGAQDRRESDRIAPLTTRVVIPAGVARVQPRLVGVGPATIWVGAFSVRMVGNVNEMRPANVPEIIPLKTEHLQVDVRTSDLSFTVRDLASGKTYEQRPDTVELVCTGATVEPSRAVIQAQYVPTGAAMTVTIALDADRPELRVSLAGQTPLSRAVSFPHRFVTRPGERMILPMNEGIGFDVEDPAAPLGWNLVTSGGHGLCMAFWGVTDGQAGWMNIIETPDDAAAGVRRSGGEPLTSLATLWEPQKGQLGYARTLKLVFLPSGGHVAMAKRYRQHAIETGLFKTLEQKRAEVPAVDSLVGAVNVWSLEATTNLPFDMQDAGIDRMLWSNRAEPPFIAAMNARGILTSRYDIYQDVMDPGRFPELQWTHPDWTTPGWPKDLMIRADGEWERGWEVETKEKGKLIPCGGLCDRQAVPYALERTAAELKTHPYASRFIDTTTASPWRECYHPDHPMTRTDSRVWKMKLLEAFSKHFKLVTGSETGHDAAVPFVHYFEGMMSLGPYRTEDAGRDMTRIEDVVPPQVLKFQVGPQYRLPLWELVYHDCVVSQWYWGDYNNKQPGAWDARDRFNALYGTPPMFFLDRKQWTEKKARFVQSYQATAPIARATGYSEMTGHEYLSDDRMVQRTTFANGVRVTVNFDSRDRDAEGRTLAAGAIVTAGM